MSATTARPISEVKADLFRALAHPARVRALELLAEGELSVGEMQPLVGIESSYLSQQLGTLRRWDEAQVLVHIADGCKPVRPLQGGVGHE